MVEEEPKRLEPDPSSTDMLVAVEPRPQLGSGVVEVECDDPLKPDRRVHARERRGEARGRADVVARGEEVAGVQAEGEALRLPHGGKNCPEVLGSSAEKVPCPRRVLQGHTNPVSGGAGVELVDGLDDPDEARRAAGAAVRARVDHHERESEPLGALQLVVECAHRPPPLRVVGRGEVDQVRGVREHRADAGPSLLARELRHLVRVEGSARPLDLVLQKELDDRAAGVPTAHERLRQAPRDRHVGAEVIHPSLAVG